MPTFSNTFSLIDAVSIPLNNTEEPVICPLSLKIKLSLDDDIVFVSILNPPISPDVADILPDKSTLLAVILPW